MGDEYFNQPREFYKEEKKRVIFYRKMYGENSELIEPYSEEEIQEYESKYKIKLPPNFRNYLINISRETIGSYIWTVELNKPYEMDFRGESVHFIKTHENGCTCDYYICIKGKYYGYMCRWDGDFEVESYWK